MLLTFLSNQIYYHLFGLHFLSKMALSLTFLFTVLRLILCQTITNIANQLELKIEISYAFKFVMFVTVSIVSISLVVEIMSI